MTRLRIPLSTPVRERWAAIGLVSLLAILCYGLLIPWLGFYRDDWYQLWAGLTLGPRSIVTLFSIDRPFMGLTYAATFAVLRDSAAAWQIYALLLRWIGALGALWLFRRMWPGRPFLTTSAALLFLVYPGFLQQPNADTFSNHLLSYAAEILSLAATAELLATPRGPRRWALTAFAIAAALTCWLLYEYMIGLEALRYLLIARHALAETGRLNRRWLRAFLVTFLPFLIPLAAFLVWRLGFFQATRGTVNVGQVLAAYRASPVATVLQRAVEVLRDFVETTLFGWFVPASDGLADLEPIKIVLGLLPTVVVVAVFVRYARRQAVEDTSGEAAPRPTRESAGDMILVGTFTTLASLTPVVLTGRDVRWTSAFDRYTLHATLGLAMLTVGLVAAMVRARRQTALLACLLGLSVLSHQANAFRWARFWQEERQLWWQLSWRAPGLQAGTVLMADLPSQRFFEDYEIWGPANLTYAPGDRSPGLAAEVIAEDTVPRVRLGLQDVRYMRVLIGIPRDYRNTLVVDWPSPQACVHVLGRNDPEAALTSDSLVRSIAPFSRDDRIRTDSAPVRPPRTIFGREPDHGWCWFYQTAALARQRGDWAQVVALGDQARLQGLAPADRSEWVPFWQAELNTGNAQGAAAVAQAIRQDETLAAELCDRMDLQDFAAPAAFDQARNQLCAPSGG
ncbi:MAG TPA: hypothetical protein VK449_11320 [Anaerolineales bacterium]|nr:hypothetical protein [Anaerolineales bacterium]